MSFLRDDQGFLAGAFAHPTARFLVFKDLSPLIKSPTEIHYATYDDIKALVPTNPFERTEKEIVDDFDSRIDTPQLIFLGIDEYIKDGYAYKNFQGGPHWAIDITPKKTYEKEANELNEKFLAAGLKFSEGMRAMSFPPDVGEFNEQLYIEVTRVDNLSQLPNTRKVVTIWTGTTATHSVGPVVIAHCRSMLEGNVYAHLKTRPRIHLNESLAQHERRCRT